MSCLSFFLNKGFTFAISIMSGKVPAYPYAFVFWQNNLIVLFVFSVALYSLFYILMKTASLITIYVPKTSFLL
jgi:hypothetical protein